MPPVCAKCEIEFRPKKNGVVAESMATFGSMSLRSADLWECPGCGAQILHGFAKTPICERWMPEYEDRRRRIEKTYQYWATRREREIYLEEQAKEAA